MSLSVLMWKNYISRKRRFIHTTVELASTILFLLLLFFTKGVFITSIDTKHTDVLHETEPDSIDTIPKPSLIYYTPVSETTRSIMNNVGRTLMLRELPNYPENQRGYYGLRNVSDIVGFIENMRDSHAFVVFQDMEDVMPDRLNYTIRMKSNFRTDFIEAFDDNIADSHHGFVAIYYPFLRLQWAIDKSYLEIRTGTTITQNVTLQELPYSNVPKNTWVSLVVQMIAFITNAALLLPFVFLITRTVEERVNGLQELLKMSGVSVPMILASHLLNVLPTGLVFSLVGAMLLKISSTPIIPTTNFFFIFVPLLLHFYSLMLVAMVCSFILNKAQYVTAVACVLYLVANMPEIILSHFSLPTFFRVLMGIMPFVPFSWYHRELAALETYGQGISFSTMMSSHTENSMAVGLSLFWWVAQCALFSALVLLLSRVRPGPYGTPQPCFAWGKKKADQDTTVSEQEEPMARDPNYFETAPANKDVGVRIVNVSKMFGTNKTHALSNVTFDVFHGEITVLLGHNGAGKTTLLSIITGMLPATAGKVYVNGHDASTDQSKVRKQIGLCTQHDLFFPDLNILEHVMFFSMLKGHTLREARVSSLKLLEELMIREKENQKSTELSGGMKRRLQLACALAGGSSVLVLDEPTSGLDVETRRELWDLLLELRGTRTVLLTTHFMEEADALGDRVAALHEGTLRCHATPMHLKKHIGSGYRLTLSTIGFPKEPTITSAVTSSVTDATLRQQGPTTITYDLPAKNTSQFPGLFQKLEDRRLELGVESIAVSMPTLEEVFLRLCSNVETTFEDETDGLGGNKITYKKLSGFPLYQRQFVTLIKRHFYFVLDSKSSLLIWQILVPIALIFSLTASSYQAPAPARPASNTTSMDLAMYSHLPYRSVFYGGQGAGLETLRAAYKDVHFTEVRDVVDSAWELGRSNLHEYKKYLAGVQVNETDAKVLYTTRVRHVAPVALNLLSNVLAAELIPGSSGRVIETRNHPLVHVRTADSSTPLVDEATVMFWALILGIMFLCQVANSSDISCKEAVTGTRHLYLMAGCSVPLFWLTRLVFYWVFHFIVMCVPTLISVEIFEQARLIWDAEALGTLVLMFACGLCSWVSLVNLVCLFASERVTTAVTVGLTFVFGCFGAAVLTTLDKLPPTVVSGIFRVLLKLAEYTQAPMTFSVGIIKTSEAARANAYCEVNKHLCPLLTPAGPPFDLLKCCGQMQKPVEYFSFDKFAPLLHIILLIIQSVLQMALIIMIEKGWFQNITFKKYVQPPQQFDDPLVTAEKTYVSKAIEMPKNQIKDVMLVNNLHKKYFSWGRIEPAVRGVSFSVKQGECFGVLGVNGAGKSTTFKMIVGEIGASHGSTFANSHFLTTERQAYLRSLSYCPQFSGLDTYMTGHQNLHTLLTLRGLAEEDVQAEINACLSVVGLQSYRNRKVRGYSGGCVRRLSSGAALSGGAALTLLDEPTCGVDVTARRRVWACIRRAMHYNKALIITSHSMDEMEALCQRIAVLSRGEVRALGSPAALRAAHAAGHAVVLKLAADRAHIENGTSPVVELKGAMHQTFNCVLKDAHTTMLHYHINDALKNSELFTNLEKLKARFPIIEDYSVSATTLEEVFLAFAQEAHGHRKEGHRPAVPV